MKSNGASVLIVDDDIDIRELMKMLLEAEGYSVDVAADGLEALRRLQTGQRPGLILLDLMMPRMDGEQFVKEMHSKGCDDVPVVLVSGHVGAQKKAVELDAAGCLMKPVECDELLNIVRQVAPTLAHKSHS